MSIAIVYFTKSKKGNTKKLADFVSNLLSAEAKDVSFPLEEKKEKVLLINAMYAANVDKNVKAFLKNNADKIGTLYNINTSASGASTYKVIAKAAKKYGIAISSKEFHCPASWLGINKDRPNQDDFTHLEAFIKDICHE